MRSSIPLLCCLAMLVACDDGQTSAAVGADAQDVTVDAAQPTPDATDAVDAGEDYVPRGAPLGDSGYAFTLELSDGQTYALERDLTEEPGSFSFGSTRIAPAVSLAVQDHTFDPFLYMTLNFGFVVGSPDHPATIHGPGTYVLGGVLPRVVVELPPRTYSSEQSGAVGTLEITDFSAEAGGLFAGSISATLVDETDPQRYATLNGTFHFVLPQPDGGTFR